MDVEDATLRIVRGRRGRERGRRLALALALAALATASAAETAVEPALGGADVAFRDAVVARTAGVASIALSPDGGRLYATTLFGKLLRWRVSPEDGSLLDPEEIAPDHFQSPAGPRSLIGLAFDPADPNRLWVVDNHPVPLNGSDPSFPDFSGRISIVDIAPEGPFRVEARAYVTGLPRSCADHVTNSLAFHDVVDPATGRSATHLYVSQGSNTARGAAEKRWCDRPERLLGAAILEVDPRREAPPGGFDVATEPLPTDPAVPRFGSGGLIAAITGAGGSALDQPIAVDSGPHAGGWLRFDARGVAAIHAGREADSPARIRFYDPFAPDAPVRLYATGLRNAFDFAFGPDGLVYAALNGSGGGGRVPDDPATPADESRLVIGREEDRLVIVERGDYGGHPNPLRREFVANGGNPTAGPDHDEVPAYPVGIMPDPRLRLDRVFPLGFHWSPTGTVVLPATDCAPDLCGAVLFSNYSKNNTLRAMRFDAGGRVAADFQLRDVDGRVIAHRDPIDIAVGQGGRLYLATLERSNGASRIVRLDPAAPGGALGEVALRLLDASDPAAPRFRLTGAGVAGMGLTVSVDGGAAQAVTADAEGVIALALPGMAAGEPVEAAFDAPGPDGPVRLARIGFLAGGPPGTLAVDGARFEAATDAEGRQAGVLRRAGEPDTLEAAPDAAADADGDRLNDGFRGWGYFDFDGGLSGAEASFVIDVPEAGPYEVTLRLANGTRDPRPLRIEVEETGDSALLTDTRSGAWSNWRDHVTTLLLESGANRLRLVQMGEQGPNVDMAVIRPGG